MSRHHFSAAHTTECQHLHGSNFEKANTILQAVDPTTPSPEPRSTGKFGDHGASSISFVSSESLTRGPGCSRGEPHGAQLDPIHKLLPVACGPLFKKDQTCLSRVLHLPKIALPIHPFITPLVTDLRHGSRHPLWGSYPHCRNSTLIYRI